MKLILGVIAALTFTGSALAQVPVTPNPNYEQMIASADPKLAANKKLVYDLLREVFEGGHVELAEKYMTEGYIQHNPSIPTGRAAFIERFSKFMKPKPIQARSSLPLVGIIAEGDYVVVAMVREYPEPTDASKKYTTTWFDMYRIEGGKVAEHWDGAQKMPPMPPTPVAPAKP